MSQEQGKTQVVRVPAERVVRWIENFQTRHGATQFATTDGRLRGVAEDGSSFAASLPFDLSYAGTSDDAENDPPDQRDPRDFAAAVVTPVDWGVLLVRKGGFAMARLHGDRIVESKVGQRHVQGRTKAGGQSQQRFARRRDNQARQAMEAAGGHAQRILAGAPILVVGGDRTAIEATLEDARLAADVVGDFLTVPDPRRAILEQAIKDARAARFEVNNT